MFDYLFFDLDGTLTDSAPGIFNAVKYALNEMKEPIPADTELRKFIGPPLTYSFKNFCGMSEERTDEAVRLYRVYYPEKGIFENFVYAGILTLLQKLKDNGKHLVVATSKPETFTLRILEHFDLMKYFEFVSAASLDSRRATKDKVIEWALKELKITDKNQVVMIGDRYHDIEGAKANSLKSIGVLYGYGSLEELKKAGADYIAETVADIEGLV